MNLNCNVLVAIKSDAESVKVLPSDNQNITSEAPKLLLCSSIASGSDLGSNEGVTPLAGIGKEYPELSWYYLYLSNKELKRYISVFSGRKAVRLRTLSGSVEEEFFCFKVFSYTAADHRKRFEQCAYTKEEYTARRDSARVVKEAFATGSTQKLNTLTDEKEIAGNGWLFVCAPLDQLERILSALSLIHISEPTRLRRRAAVIPQSQMEEFIYLYESMPYNIELMNRPLEDYLQKKQKIRITGGVFRGKEGCIMRLHRNTRLVFAFGNMTVAVSYLHAFPFEKIE
mgnify:FL=1